jgi:hypothetical protein
VNINISFKLTCALEVKSKVKMRWILIKLLALKNSISIARGTMYVTLGSVACDVTYDATWDAACDVVCDALHATVMDAASDAALDVVMGESFRVAKQGKTLEEVTNLTCLYVMNNYDKILSFVVNLGTKIQPNENINWSKALRRLITFNGKTMKELGLMNRRFRFFYFFRVHELFSLLEENEQLITDFYKLVQTIGDLECYNELFITNISLELIDEETNIPRDVAKIILDYSNFSVHNPDDVVLVHNKIKG